MVGGRGRDLGGIEASRLGVPGVFETCGLIHKLTCEAPVSARGWLTRGTRACEEIHDDSREANWQAGLARCDLTDPAFLLRIGQALSLLPLAGYQVGEF